MQEKWQSGTELYQLTVTTYFKNIYNLWPVVKVIEVSSNNYNLFKLPSTLLLCSGSVVSNSAANGLKHVRLLCPFTISWSLLQHILIASVVPTNHLIFCCPLLLLPPVFPRTRVFSNESVLHIRWPKYWSFSFSISPYNEYSGLISLRIDW